MGTNGTNETDGSKARMPKKDLEYLQRLGYLEAQQSIPPP